jgi:predicted ABC-class ATPase
MGSAADLQRTLQRIDGKSYNAYKDIRGIWTLEAVAVGCEVGVDHVQGDAYAPPSRCHLSMPIASAGIPDDLVGSRARRTALADYLARRFFAAARGAGADQGAGRGGGWSGPKGGDVGIDEPGQCVLERTSVLIRAGRVEARFTVALPARGRSIMGAQAARILTSTVPDLARASLTWTGALVDRSEARRWCESVEDQQHLRGLLAPAGLCAFVADGAVLPRLSGEDDRPMPESAGPVPFASPATLRREFRLPNAGVVTGMAVPRGVTLIVGGGFHGKSTLLKALEVGVYDKIPGDGRELVVTDAGAVKIRAEDGRAVHDLDISGFIGALPQGKGTSRFSTRDASGSTSQAANIVEAVQAGSRTLLLDEDTCATNFMARDERMAALVQPSKEPITPFLDRVRPLWVGLGVSTVLVVGGAGAFFDAADVVVAMENYACRDVTARAKAIARAFAARDAQLPPLPPSEAEAEAATGPVAKRARNGSAASGSADKGSTDKGSADSGSADAGGAFAATLRASGASNARAPRPGSLQASGERGGRVSCRRNRVVQFGDAELRLDAVEQLVETSQTRAVGHALSWLARQPRAETMAGLAAAVAEALLDDRGLDNFGPFERLGNLAAPRPVEVVAAVNRLRQAEMVRA